MSLLTYAQQYNNFSGYVSIASLVFNLVLAAGYAAQKDYRRALYFFFAFCITATVVVK